MDNPDSVYRMYTVWGLWRNNLTNAINMHSIYSLISRNDILHGIKRFSTPASTVSQFHFFFLSFEFIANWLSWKSWYDTHFLLAFSDWVLLEEVELNFTNLSTYVLLYITKYLYILKVFIYIAVYSISVWLSFLVSSSIFKCGFALSFLQ